MDKMSHHIDSLSNIDVGVHLLIEGVVFHNYHM